MREHPNAVVVRQFYEAVARAHRDDIQLVLAAACSLSVDGGHRMSGTFGGSRGVAEWFSRASRLAAGGLSLTPLTISAIGSVAVALEHVYATHEDSVLSVDSLRVFNVEGGRIQRIRAIDLEPASVARFWGVASEAASSLQGAPRTIATVTPMAGSTPRRDA